MFSWDSTVFLWINAGADSPVWLVAFARIVTREIPEWLAAGTLGAFLVGDVRIRACLLRVCIAMLAAWALAQLGKFFIPTPRPFSLGLGTMWYPHGSSSGFPSSHACVMFAFSSAIAMATRRWLLASSGLALAVLVAWSRVCLGLHFPSDVAIGALLGVACAFLSAHIPMAQLEFALSRIHAARWKPLA